MSIPSNPRAAVLSALMENAELKGRLAADPDDVGHPAVFLFDDAHPPVYPCVVYQWPQNVPDERFRPTAVEGGGSSPILDARVELRCYSKGTVADRDVIALAAKTALDGRVLVFAYGRIFDISLVIELPDQPDPAVDTKYHLLRFRLRVSLTLP